MSAEKLASLIGLDDEQLAKFRAEVRLHVVTLPLGPGGFFAVCLCGWRSGDHQSKADASAEAANHRKERGLAAI